MPRRPTYKSPGYLNFVAENYPCCVTGTWNNVDLHHESLGKHYSGDAKRKFDFGVVPLEHGLHLYERHEVGSYKFWRKYGKDPLEIAMSMVLAYIDTEPEDKYLAQGALEVMRDVWARTRS